MQLKGCDDNIRLFSYTTHRSKAQPLPSFVEGRRAPGRFEDHYQSTFNSQGVAQASAGRNDLVVRGARFPSENLYILDGD
ncbi:MAG: hypothetical protein IPN18_14540 [Ignavibacteriales bacterium]|nr:hypothetical protein [Ignavibacteriales bacterium]